MSITDQLLETLINEVRGLRTDMAHLPVRQSVDTCKLDEALIIAGLTNHRHLKYFADKGIIKRLGGGTKGYTYYKSELAELSAKIKADIIHLPKIKELYIK